MPRPANSRTTALCLAVVSALLLVAADARPEPQYPAARREANVQEIHGIEVADPYRWMENSQAAELERWVQAQDRLTTAFVAGDDFNRAKSRIRALATYDLGFAGKRRGERLFYLLRPRGGSTVEIRVRNKDRMRILLMADGIPDGDFAERHIGGLAFVPSLWPDRSGDMVAYLYTDGTERARLRIVETGTGQHLPDVIEEISVSAAISWSATGDGFYYARSRMARSDGATETKWIPAGLWFHRLGTPQHDDVIIIEQYAADRYIYTPNTTTKGDRLVVAKREGTSQTTTYLVYETADLHARPVVLFEDLDARFIFLGNNGSRLFFQTNYGSPNGRVVAIDLLEPDKLVELVAETARPMLAGSNVGGDIVGYFGGYFVLGYLRDGLADVRIIDEQGTLRETLELPPGSSMWGAMDSVPGSTRVTVSLLNPFSPGHVITFDARDGSVRDELTADVAVKAEDFAVLRVFVTSRDGTRVPMSVVHRKDLKRDGQNPVLIYGYGMHKWVSLLFYQAHIVHWLELGGVYAVPAIRGGGEYGDQWHEDGIRTNRQNAIDDFVASGRWLIDNGYTSPDKLAANGGSASGALAGMVALRHGDVFAATTVDYPIADLLRAPLYGSGAILVDEYGSLDDPDEGQALMAQSPYHQVETDRCYMPTLVLVGEADKVALPFHGYKLVAALQHAQNCDNAILLHKMADTGHNFGRSPERVAHNTAVQIAFLVKVLEL